MCLHYLRHSAFSHRLLHRKVLLRSLMPLPIAAALLFVMLWTLPVTAQDSTQPNRGHMTPPTADFTIDPLDGVVGTIFFFDALISSDSEDSDAWLLVRFDFEDDGTWDTTWLNPTNSPWRHTYSSAGIYSIRLEVKDQDEMTDTLTRSLGVGDPGTNTLPSAVCNVVPSIGPPGTEFTFDAASSSDAEDPIGDLSVKWAKWGSLDFRGQGWQSPTQPITFAYTIPGLHRIDLAVMDSGKLIDTASCEIEIEPIGGNTAPTAGMIISPTQGTAATPFAFDIRSSSDKDDLIASLSVRFDWTDDGTYDSGWLNASQHWEHTFTDVFGQVTVRAQIRDSGGLTDEVTQTVTVFYQILMPLLAP